MIFMHQGLIVYVESAQISVVLVFHFLVVVVQSEDEYRNRGRSCVKVDLEVQVK